MKEVILLHGALGAAADFDPLLKELEKRNLNTHVLNFSGHSGTPFPEKFGIELFSDELETVLKSLAGKSVVIFGYSMGGYVALYNAFKNQRRFQKIITLGTKFDWNPATVKKETGFLNPEVLLLKAPGFVQALKQKHGSSWELLVTKTAALMQEICEKQFLNEQALRVIHARTLLMRAEDDTMVSPVETTAVFRQLPSAQMLTIPGAKHPLESIDCKLLADIISEQ